MIDIPVISDTGCWFKEHSSNIEDRTVEIYNYGDVVTCPRIMWDGNGGEIVVPSGATFTLPPVSETRVLYLDNSKSNMVTDLDGNVDKELSKRLAQQVYSEGVPEDTVRTYQVPVGARVVYDVGLYDPWR